ncbi:MAG: sterol desaturase/sphingolipid hydroxylase (fatty acid hydroxylase superfamily) [Saprospiraceae bacterium]|jgi:alkylglycerol monooxygenase
MDEMGSLAYAGYIVPFVVLLPVLEYYISKRKKIDAYSFSDTLVNFSCGILERTFDFFFILFLYFVFGYLYENASLIHLDTWLPLPILWISALLVGDFVAYWHHRLSHEINFLWAAHIVHHQSEELNVTTVFRVSAFAVINRTLFWIWLPIIGFSPMVSSTAIMFIGLYQFFSHTRLINKLGFLEYIIITPSHHRVHHARNPQYIDKNYGHVFIFWDKIFGTFEPELEEPEYGIVDGFESSNPIWAYFSYWFDLFKRAGKTKNWINKVKMFLMPPAWNPTDVPTKLENFEVDENGKRKKYKPVIPKKLRVYLIVNIIITLIIFIILLLGKNFPIITKIQLMSLVVISIVSFGPLLERKAWGIRFDFIKLIIIAINIPILLWNYPYSTLTIITALTLVIGLIVWLQILKRRVKFF